MMPELPEPKGNISAKRNVFFTNRQTDALITYMAEGGQESYSLSNFRSICNRRAGYGLVSSDNANDTLRRYLETGICNGYIEQGERHVGKHNIVMAIYTLTPRGQQYYANTLKRELDRFLATSMELPELVGNWRTNKSRRPQGGNEVGGP